MKKPEKKPRMTRRIKQIYSITETSCRGYSPFDYILIIESRLSKKA